MSSHHTRRAVVQDENASAALLRAKSASATVTGNKGSAKEAVKPVATAASNIGGGGPLTRKRAALGEINKNVSNNLVSGPKSRTKSSSIKPLIQVHDAQPPLKFLKEPVQEPRRRLRSAVPLATVSNASTASSRLGSGKPSGGMKSTEASASSQSSREHTVIKRLPSVQDVRVSKRPKVYDERATEIQPQQSEQDLAEEEKETSPLTSTEAADQEPQPIPACLTRLQGIEYSWADLDAEDIEDPTMVSEYAQDIFEHLWSVERKYLPIPDYPTEIQEGGMSWRTRGILIDWLVEVHVKFRLLPETFFLAVNIIDRYFSREKTALHEIQLFGIASLFIASKYEEVYCPTVKNLSFVAEGYTDEEILLAEKEVLRVLEFDLTYPNPMNFLRRISKADDYDMETRTIGKYLLEVSLLDHRLLPYPPSWTSAAAMFLARLILDRPDWDGNLMHYSGYPKHDLYPVVNIMIDYIASRVIHEAFFKKYASRKFLKASILCRSWVKEMLADEAKLRSIYPGYAPVEEKLLG